mgnify:CR=1 FL=1
MKRLFIITVLFFAINTANSQCSTCPPPPSGGGIGFDDDVNDEVPISGFVALGLAIGAIYGIRKVK